MNTEMALIILTHLRAEQELRVLDSEDRALVVKASKVLSLAYNQIKDRSVFKDGQCFAAGGCRLDYTIGEL